MPPEAEVEMHCTDISVASILFRPSPKGIPIGHFNGFRQCSYRLYGFVISSRPLSDQGVMVFGYLWLMGTVKGIRKLTTFIRRSGAFDKTEAKITKTSEEVEGERREEEEREFMREREAEWNAIN